MHRCEGNSVYEFGLLYVCVRNIAMSASWHLCPQPDFTRYAPLHLGAHRLAVSKHINNIAMSCRMASQRGVRLEDKLPSDKDLAVQSVASEWPDSMGGRCENKEGVT